MQEPKPQSGKTAGTNLQKESLSVLDGPKSKSCAGLQGENPVPEVLPVPGAEQFIAHPPPALAAPFKVRGVVCNPVMSVHGFGPKFVQMSDSKSVLM